MKEYLNKLRKDYSMMALNEADVDKNPIVQFENWMIDAVNAEVNEPNAMVLSTADKNGHPHSRIVLLRNIQAHGFIFYTNYESSKGVELAQQPMISINFFWADIERQVRIEGKTEKLHLLESSEYYKSRPRENQLSAWASPQSKVIGSRTELEQLWKEAEKKWKNEVEVERPPFWGGYSVKPHMFEFWQGRPGRLHDRIRYRLENEVWVIERLAP